MRNPVAITTGISQAGTHGSLANDRSVPVYADTVVAPGAPPSAAPWAVTTATRTPANPQRAPTATDPHAHPTHPPHAPSTAAGGLPPPRFAHDADPDGSP